MVLYNFLSSLPPDLIRMALSSLPADLIRHQKRALSRRVFSLDQLFSLVCFWLELFKKVPSYGRDAGFYEGVNFTHQRC